MNSENECKPQVKGGEWGKKRRTYILKSAIYWRLIQRKEIRKRLSIRGNFEKRKRKEGNKVGSEWESGQKRHVRLREEESRASQEKKGGLRWKAQSRKKGTNDLLVRYG